MKRVLYQIAHWTEHRNEQCRSQEYKQESSVDDSVFVLCQRITIRTVSRINYPLFLFFFFFFFFFLILLALVYKDLNYNDCSNNSSSANLWVLVFVGWLVGWLAGLGCLVAWLVGWLAGRSVGRSVFFSGGGGWDGRGSFFLFWFLKRCSDLNKRRQVTAKTNVRWFWPQTLLWF